MLEPFLQQIFFYPRLIFPETPSPTSAIPTPRSEIKVGKMGTNIPIPSCMINPDT